MCVRAAGSRTQRYRLSVLEVSSVVYFLCLLPVFYLLVVCSIGGVRSECVRMSLYLVMTKR